MNDEPSNGSGRGEGIRFTDREVVALRTLRTFAHSSLTAASPELLARGQSLDLARALEGIAVIDRVTGDGPATFSREEQALACIRVAHSAGYLVAFLPDGSVGFKREAIAIVVEGILEADEGLEEPLTRYLSKLRDHHEEFVVWLERSTDDDGESEA